MSKRSSAASKSAGCSASAALKQKPPSPYSRTSSSRARRLRRSSNHSARSLPAASVQEKKASPAPASQRISAPTATARFCAAAGESLCASLPGERGRDQLSA